MRVSYYIRRENSYLIFLGVMFFISLLSSFITYIAEINTAGSEFGGLEDLFFWWIASMTTVGSGPAPITLVGKLFGLVTMISGALLYLGLLTEVLYQIRARSDSRVNGVDSYNGQDSVVIIGYNTLVIGLINLLDSHLKPNIDIVLMADNLEKNPNPERVIFVKSNPISIRAMERINADKAKVVFVMSDLELPTRKSDITTVLLGNLIETLNQKVFTLVEVDNKRNKLQNAQRIDEFFTVEELLNDLQLDSVDSKIFRKIPKSIRDEIKKS